jgi:peptidoglycan/LPS O-acetylase OafA/YrhL
MKSDKSSASVYFPGLNGIRIISCYIVVIFHTNQLKGVFGYDKFNLNAIGPGQMYLTMFFVLSGFLITYLMLLERQRTNSFNIRKFYMRRIFRIWPLYFVMSILGFAVLPHFEMFQFPDNNILDYENYWEFLTAFVFFFPHLHGITYDVNITLSPMWSIGVEEQFYLIWPFVVGYTKKPIRVLVSVILIFLLLRFVDNIGIFLGVTDERTISQLRWLSAYFYKFRFGTMAIGGLLAYAYVRKIKLINILYHPITQWAAWLGLLSLQVFPEIRPKLLEHEVYSTIFAVIIINLATNPKVLFSLENKWLRYLGDLTYASYVFHIPCILFAVYILKQWLQVDLNTVLGNVLLFGLSTITTFSLAYLSFTYFETYFMKIKNRFAVVKSGTQPVK